jgi:hypothetical protein
MSAINCIGFSVSYATIEPLLLAFVFGLIKEPGLPVFIQPVDKEVMIAFMGGNND